MKKIVAFGEIMLRLTPPENLMISEAKSFSACYGGTESNVLVCLSGLGDKTCYITALPNTSLGDGAVKHLKSYGVDTGHIIRKGDNMGMYFLEEGFGKRQNKVIYNRKHAVVNEIAEEELCFDEIFKDCGIFHISGISFFISENAKKISFKLIEEAKKRGILISFDFNYRAKLKTIPEAKAIYKEIAGLIDIMFCSERDLVTFLNTDKKEFYTKFDTKYLIVREREILDNGKQKAKAEIFCRQNDEIETESVYSSEFPVLERIGSGDAFVAGTLHILNSSDNLFDALSFGMECFVLKHTVKGDVLYIKEEEIRGYIDEKTRDVSR